ncbi:MULTISPECIES: DUF2325 domain-containing protein [unclassified Paenibacillus]|uniref:DUF2325 domain-containing protein n=1 Tax=Paenibacillus provencensis TaxID=441151 RepID=A0ABW3Q1T5_9BACL|nr:MULTISPECIES: DUF2325 domain-containing protein [unclassified Paenibacillus]SDX87953.1 hypothetical protein SAMN05518848_12227 [Paenibacillus sp. PDC88]SFS99194.1 hypothetical protein SAMN04488601_1154 [Paenibacillus sp. 453mf]
MLTLQRELRTLEKSHQRLTSEYNMLKTDYESNEKIVIELQQFSEAEKMRASTLEREKLELANQLRKAQKSIDLREASEQNLKTKHEAEIIRFKSVINRLNSELASLKEQGRTELMVDRIIQVLNLRVDNLYAIMRGSSAPQQKELIRAKLSDALLLINSLESFFKSTHDEFSSKTESFYSDSSNGAPAISDLDRITKPMEIRDESTQQKETESSKPSLGTFFRKDHGGYIVMENNETFNIPESVVNSIGLEHEAEVACEPQAREDGSVAQNIQLLLQGDDSHAPIHQYMGYIELGSHFTYYCVDINNPENKFPIYEKDVDMQDPQDGDPCSFNVAIGGDYARLSRVFKRTEPLATHESLLKTKTSNRSKAEKQVGERFLEGCKIVIVGGLSKWFEVVVKETGAELIHETGENPERIHAQLRRANAMFLLLSANSHKATWSCIDIAKENRIPHFRIEGSKSNLRMQLWENQQIIRGEHVHGEHE